MFFFLFYFMLFFFNTDHLFTVAMVDDFSIEPRAATRACLVCLPVRAPGVAQADTPKKHK